MVQWPPAENEHWVPRGEQEEKAMTALTFGLFDHLDRRQAPLTQIYEERLQLLAAADAAGFYCYHVAEHHMTPLGMAPSPGIFLAAVVQRTRRLRCGPLVYLLPLYHPLRLIEEICMLDNLSNGRLDVGVGRGISPYELAYFGVNTAESRDIFEEALAVLVAGLSGARLTHRGEYYRYRDVPMELQPVQQPYPPLWYGASSQEAALWAGQRGLQVVGGGPNALLRETMQYYRDAWEKPCQDSARYNPQVQTPLMGALRHVYVAETDAEAEAAARPAYRFWYNSLVKLWRDFRSTPIAFTDDLEVARQRNAAIVGSPDTVREQVARFAEESGCNYLVCSFAFGTLTHEQAARSLDLFATKVMPAFTHATGV
jgi:alkanesulfonate monooxygenase SsuD/methylene tetrahydromethanopterin reductase-like flavin-dependent oxidoreductase (luciferase family)